MRINPNETMALIIDFQTKLFPVIKDKEELESNTLKLLQGLKVLNIPTIITEQYSKGLGETIKPIRQQLGDNYTPMEKLTFSCADDHAISKAIAEQGKKNIIVCGIEAHICVLQTVLDLKEQQYEVILIEDCIGSRKKNDKKIAMERARQEKAVISTYESILFELKRQAGDDQFKEISKIIK